MKRLSAMAAGLLLSAALLGAGEKTMMHCFAFTAIDTASDADWQAFFKASDALPGKIKSIKRVWYGKLRQPLAQFVTDAETRKKLAGGDKEVSGPVSRLQRQWGMCMEMTGPEALKAYVDDPAHKEWVEVYSKVRVAGTTTYDIIGQ